jgi:hypothetical protein
MSLAFSLGKLVGTYRGTTTKPPAMYCALASYFEQHFQGTPAGQAAACPAHVQQWLFDFGLQSAPHAVAGECGDSSLTA